MKHKSVLFVCMGNTCRSAMAQGIAEARWRNIDFSSAGITAMEGEPANPNAVEAAALYKADISRHRSRRLTESMLLNAGLVVLVNSAYKPYMPPIGNIVAPVDFGARDINDPFGGGPQVYAACAAEINRMLTKLITSGLTEND